MAFGSLGDLSRFVSGSQQDTSLLPDWLRSQLQYQPQTDESGGEHGYFGWGTGSPANATWNPNPFGGFQRDGKYWVQVGQNQLKNPNAITKDPELGDITEASNVFDPSIGGLRGAAPFLAAFLGGGLALGALGAGAAAGSGLGEGIGGTMTGLAGDESAGLAMGNAFGGGAGGGAFTGGGWGFDPSTGSSGLLGGGESGLGSGGGLTGGDLPYGTEMPNTYAPGANPTAFSPAAPLQATPWWQSALANMAQNPQNALRIASGLYSMLGSHGNQGGAPAGSNMSALLGNAPQFAPAQMPAFQQNPYLLAQMNNVPFMGGSHVLGF